MASDKAKLLEQSLQDDLHPFAARMSPAASSPEELREAVGRSNDLKNERPTEPTTERSFDLNRNASIRRAFNFTEEELYAIEDLKIDLSRKYDLQVTLYDVVRMGVHEIVEDYLANRDKSIVIKRAESKVPK